MSGDTSWQAQTHNVLNYAGSDPDGYLGRLTPTQQGLLDQMRSTLTQDSPGHGMNDADLCRYLRAREWNLNKALEMIKATLKWRSEVRPEQIQLEKVREMYDRGEVLPVGKDKRGRPVFWSFTAKHNPAMAELAFMNNLYLIERFVSEMQDGEECLACVFDMTNYTLANKDDAWRKKVVTALQNHYPERMGMFVIVNPPPIFSVIWWGLKMLMSKRTTSKFMFIKGDVLPQLRELFDDDQIPEALGGQLKVTPQQWVEAQCGPAPADRVEPERPKGWLAGWAKWFGRADAPAPDTS
mmetsp:Transcript_36004/g.72237  ORF Transcript_36004/g.72237 Transcript_36004/m.72237 type:complete len:296 (-) Transcript_36004:143-1030(-)